jgi:endonuclease III related protein
MIRQIYRRFDWHFGDLKWWPARSRFEVIVGAILTQNTSWKNVEKAIRELRARKLLSLKAMSSARRGYIESAVRCTGYYRQKTDRLKDVCKFLISECGYGLKRSDLVSTDILREKFLSIKGIGPETADSILLYAFKRPIFVVDAYTMRIFERHRIIGAKTKYEVVQEMVHSALGRDTDVFNQFHALLVEVGKEFCRKKVGNCGECPAKCLL